MSYHGHGGPPAGGFGYPPAGGYGPPPGGPPAGGYGPPAGGYGPPAGGYGPPAGGYGSPAGGFGYPAAGGPHTGGYGPPAGGPPAGGYGPPAGGFGYPAAGGPPAGMAPNIGRYGQQGDAATQGYQNDGSGALWCAVANTQWGTIPGKAKDRTCWYSYAGKEHVTSDFSWLNSTTPLQKVKNQGSMPEGVVPGGFQSDGSGHYYPAIAETRHGQIPGKAKGNTCWYPYGGKEQTTSNFSWIVQRPSLRLERRAGAPPNGVKLAFQTDGGGEQWSAVADTPHGNIPGKAKGSTCWYAYGGKEHTTSSFSWLVCNSPVYAVPNEGRPPRGAFKCGHQTDGGGDFYAAIANTDWGTIPGKAKDNTCWYAYGGKEHYTSKFLWITSVQ